MPDVLSARGWTPAEAVGNLVGDLAKIDHGVKIVHNVPAAARRELKKAGAK
ncbi:MAG: hypothetical protein ABI780_02625 [Ardenticatenales bacterium]